jgi:hypothetical protein
MIVKIVVPSPTGTPRASKFLEPLLWSIIHTCTTESIVDSMAGDDEALCIVVDKVVAVVGVDVVTVDRITELFGVEVVVGVVACVEVITDVFTIVDVVALVGVIMRYPINPNIPRI